VARDSESGTLAGVRQARLILVTGLPGTGKSTLARLLARRYGSPLICKDTIKEPLLDVMGADGRAESRRLSDASFAIMFALARECLAAGTDLILEGNFRPGEHEPALRGFVLPTARIAQVICCASEPVRIARLKARAIDPLRHAGHRDADFANEKTQPSIDTLGLPGEHFVFDTDGVGTVEDGVARAEPLLDALDQWRRRDLRA
jgi:predicted kinase